ncbi:protein S100-B-like [Etheostoma cragini]|uniref:protein S100-B-like n=1 Tax=Etheostoma cragini TaxID=417921 RepID=UPI00155EAA31|nr:protein S100-B-like [Etheostoma cragini]
MLASIPPDLISSEVTAENVTAHKNFTETPYPPPLDNASTHLCQPRNCSGFFFCLGKMSDLQSAVALLIKVFHSYSGKEGDKHKLNKAELKTLLKNELGLKDDGSPEVQDIIKSLDADKDGEVDFQEYVIFVASLVMVMEEFFKK